LEDCAVVNQELLAGKLPAKTCGYAGLDPIVCCPTNNIKPTSKPVRPVQSDPKPFNVARASKYKNSLF